MTGRTGRPVEESGREAIADNAPVGTFGGGFFWLGEVRAGVGRCGEKVGRKRRVAWAPPCRSRTTHSPPSCCWWYGRDHRVTRAKYSIRQGEQKDKWCADPATARSAAVPEEKNKGGIGFSGSCFRHLAPAGPISAGPYAGRLVPASAL